MKRFLIIVEGDADKKFIQDYYHHLFGEEAPENSIIHSGKNSDTGGLGKLKSEETLQALRQNTDQGGVNLVIFDADENPAERRAELLAIKEAYGVEFELFLLPNDKNCWQTYEGELAKVRIPTKTPPTLTIPAKKTKIYAYLETLLGKTRSQKELIKDRNRNYENTQHWNLEAKYLEPLREYLMKQLPNNTIPH